MRDKNFLAVAANAALTRLFAHEIREQYNYDPDHSAPEDAAEEYAGLVLAAAHDLLRNWNQDYFLEAMLNHKLKMIYITKGK